MASVSPALPGDGTGNVFAHPVWVSFCSHGARTFQGQAFWLSLSLSLGLSLLLSLSLQTRSCDSNINIEAACGQKLCLPPSDWELSVVRSYLPLQHIH